MIQEKLIAVQKELKAPKNQRNSFGGYNYRSCEDILEAVKPLLVKQGLLLTLSDEMVAVGDRIYVKTTAMVRDTDGGITVTAFAREEPEKKGMDGSQITGAASSYARKYALNGLFCIDDTKDSDYTNTGAKGEKTDKSEPQNDAKEGGSQKYECEYCHKEITKAEHDYSMKNYGHALCRGHQEMAKKQRGAK